jgi:hypothetical protein
MTIDHQCKERSSLIVVKHPNFTTCNEEMCIDDVCGLAVPASNQTGTCTVNFSTYGRALLPTQPLLTSARTQRLGLNAEAYMQQTRLEIKTDHQAGDNNSISSIFNHRIRERYKNNAAHPYIYGRLMLPALQPRHPSFLSLSFGAAMASSAAVPSLLFCLVLLVSPYLGYSCPTSYTHGGKHYVLRSNSDPRQPGQTPTCSSVHSGEASILTIILAISCVTIRICEEHSYVLVRNAYCSTL